MDFINKMKKAGEALADKAKDLGDAAALTMEKAQLKSEIENLYIEIGKKIVEENDERFTDVIAQIATKQKRIKVIEQEVDEFKGKIKCPRCGKMIDDESHFCPECGQEIE